ncbi:MAG: hypothetical protein H6696_15360 [Deferribacteres bacterium]|nr:hypothetical protein [candidate division KSB1 bacterium]MCB9503306.1 hypothetical protein [Deferribacteres bacterium]
MPALSQVEVSKPDSRSTGRFGRLSDWFKLHFPTAWALNIKKKCNKKFMVVALELSYLYSLKPVRKSISFILIWKLSRLAKTTFTIKF